MRKAGEFAEGRPRNAALVVTSIVSIAALATVAIVFASTDTGRAGVGAAAASEALVRLPGTSRPSWTDPPR